MSILGHSFSATDFTSPTWVKEIGRSPCSQPCRARNFRTTAKRYAGAASRNDSSFYPESCEPDDHFDYRLLCVKRSPTEIPEVERYRVLAISVIKGNPNEVINEEAFEVQHRDRGDAALCA